MDCRNIGVRECFVSEAEPETRERCVICGQVTDVPVNRPISKRKSYLPCAGQLCEDCCRRYCGADDLRLLPWLWEEFL